MNLGILKIGYSAVFSPRSIPLFAVIFVVFQQICVRDFGLITA